MSDSQVSGTTACDQGLRDEWIEDGRHVHLPSGRFDVDRLAWSETAFERAVRRLIEP